ncbi:MAG: hypothetical protein A2527_13315 [Candidatus Lambdaproteobacteria bacterium RIFOXYD2_FULL_50_16]|uniref:General secretion pathway protein F n=1 Tax=Candidatus Lambdaproteobacteria bacterium RIFOXYD2_FULL_50_16 TaxID=1817772 RepID=A0A1F6G535_9PROT|nr:MAG: hypothetical protein A2527_13315 [Candidatus Lambdaproteobacteria bacterium RIFOXYD2_FULL_50_16]
MALFDYQAVDSSGKTKKGQLDAPNLKQAQLKLQGMGLFPVELGEAKNKGSALRRRTQGTGRISKASITSFTRQFSVLTGAGIPYDKALEVLIQENQDPAFGPILADIRQEITEGSSLAAALESRSQHFPQMYRAMVRAGEAGGTLAKVLEELTRFREDNEKLTQKIQNALIYPMIMSVLGMGIVIFMMTFILPKITPIFGQFRVELPLPTRVVIFMSSLLTDHFLITAGFLGVLFFSIRRWQKTEKGLLYRDQVLLKIPVVGHLARQMVFYRFVQTLGTLLESGVEMKQALTILRGVLVNRVYEGPMDQMIDDIANKGLDLSAAMRKTGLFPAGLLQMIRVGEESSRLESMLEKVADNLNREMGANVERMVALLEPAMILAMALMVGFIVLAVMLPLFELNQLL